MLRGTGVGLEKQATFRADGRPGMPVSPDENLRTNPGQFKRKVQDGPILREDGSGGWKKASCKILSLKSLSPNRLFRFLMIFLQYPKLMITYRL